MGGSHAIQQLAVSMLLSGRSRAVFSIAEKVQEPMAPRSKLLLLHGMGRQVYRPPPLYHYRHLYRFTDPGAIQEEMDPGPHGDGRAGDPFLFQICPFCLP